MAALEVYYPTADGAQTMTRPTQAPQGGPASVGGNVSVSANLSSEKLPVYASLALFGIVLLGMHARG